MFRRNFFIVSAVIVLAIIATSFYFPSILFSLIVVLPLIGLGLLDAFQKKHTILRNFPLLGRMRYLFEEIRPEIYQYFVESNSEGVPFSREDRSLIYQRAKDELDTLPFGTQKNVYAGGYEWVNHSLMPKHVDLNDLRVKIGGPDCTQPYSASILNISAMSYGSMSANAILALSQGAKKGNFAHNTGEGGVSPYHLEGNADIIWQIGTGYFGCRTSDGNFCEKTFQDRVSHSNIKMVEIKLSQGAKPGHGGILPGAKVTPEIAKIRDVKVGEDVLSPPAHKAFSTPSEMMEFIKRLRELSDGKPIGFKLCVGKRREFLAICKAMLKTGIKPDFITVDGGEGGTGAAPLEFSNHIGCPLVEGLMFVHNALVGIGLRDQIKVIASGKISTGFGVIKRIALGADLCYSARAMMIALGCIQALKCNTNECPTGVATQDKLLADGLVVSDKKDRVCEYHRETVESVAEMLGAMGLSGTDELRPWHITRRISFTEIHHYGELYSFLDKDSLLKEPFPEHFERAWKAACPDTFAHAAEVTS